MDDFLADLDIGTHEGWMEGLTRAMQRFEELNKRAERVDPGPTLASAPIVALGEEEEQLVADLRSWQDAYARLRNALSQRHALAESQSGAEGARQTLRASRRGGDATNP